MLKTRIHFSLFLFPLLLSVYAAAELGIALARTGDADGTKYLLTAVLSSAVWFAFTLADYLRRPFRDDENGRGLPECAVLLACAAFLAVAIFGILYKRETFSLYPVELIDNGSKGNILDTLYHSALSEGYSVSFPTTSLVNNDVAIPYHTFSHLLIWLLARALAAPAFLIYNYLYGALFAPLYLYAQLFAVKKAKGFFTGAERLSVLDCAAVTLLNVGLYWDEGACGISRECFLVSESFTVALTIMLFFFGAGFAFLKKGGRGRLFPLLVTPMAIFFATWAKVSVGILLAGTAMYVVFRRDPKKLRSWLVIALYAAVLFLALKLSSSLFSKSAGSISGHGDEAVTWFAYKAYCSGWAGYLGHFFLIGFPGLLFLVFELTQIIRKKKRWSLWIELLVIFSVVGFLPVISMDILGGSAMYFSYVVEFPGLLLLCGNGYLDDPPRWAERKLRIPWLAGLVLVYAVFVYHEVGLSIPSVFYTGEHEVRQYEELMEIRSIVQRAPKEYALYVDEDTFRAVHGESLCEVYQYPGLTGALLINASYCHDGTYYAFTGGEASRYGLCAVTHDRLSLEEGCAEAARLGRKYLIHVTRSGFETIALPAARTED